MSGVTRRFLVPLLATSSSATSPWATAERTATFAAKALRRRSEKISDACSMRRSTRAARGEVRPLISLGEEAGGGE